MNISEERNELFKAISAAQGEFTTVDKGRDNPFFKSKYAPLDAIIEMIRPILPRHGLAVVQFTDIPENGSGIIVETIITHQSGQFISGKMLMPMVKVDPQGAGSALTYGRRYALAAALGIVSDEDEDGNHGSGNGNKPQKAAAKQPAQPKPAAQAASADPKDTEYHQRIKAALRAVYGDDREAALNKVEELTTWEKDGKTIKGSRDFTKKTGKGAQILCHQLEKLAGVRA